MESLRSFLRNCIVRVVDVSVKDTGDVFGNNVVDYHVNKDVIIDAYNEHVNEDPSSRDDLQALTYEVVAWLRFAVKNIAPYHIYLAWYAARVLMMNGFAPVTFKDVRAMFWQCRTEFAKCFSKREDYMRVVHPSVEDIFYDNDHNVVVVWSIETHLYKVVSVANKLLSNAINDHNIAHTKWSPCDVPYGLHDYLYNGERNVYDFEDDASMYNLLYEYECFVNKEYINNEVLNGVQSLYDWRHYRPCENDVNKIKDVFYNCVKHDDEPVLNVTTIHFKNVTTYHNNKLDEFETRWQGNHWINNCRSSFCDHRRFVTIKLEYCGWTDFGKYNNIYKYIRVADNDVKVVYDRAIALLSEFMKKSEDMCQTMD